MRRLAHAQEAVVGRERRGNARVLPRADVHAIRHRDDGRGAVHVRPHGARRLAVELGDGVGGARQAQPRHRHVERVAADVAHLAVHQLAARSEPAQVGERVHLVARGHRRVGGEDDALPRRLPGLLEGRPRLHAVGDQLDAREDGVALVEVVEAHGQVQRPERAHAADAEQHLLGEPAIRARVVETAGDPAVPRIHGLEQEERRDRVPAHAPHAADDLAAADAHADADAGVREEGRLVIVPLVDRIAVGADALRAYSPAPSAARRRRRAGRDPPPIS